MATSRDQIGERLLGVLSLLVVGLGLLDLFANVLPGVPFFLVFIIGFAVVLPIVSLLLGVDDDDDDWSNDQMWGGRGTETEEEPDEEAEPTTSTTDAIETLRDRYARGELTDEQFERKLDRLLETDTPENAADWRREEREREPEFGTER